MTIGIQPASSVNFRSDINGLRAWAVMMVVFYHFGVPGFSGGFVGVDVFFVISGFLMTRIIIDGLNRPSGEGRGFSHSAGAHRVVRGASRTGVVLLALARLHDAGNAHANQLGISVEYPVLARVGLLRCGIAR